MAAQRYRAVLEVLDEGAGVTDVARRYGVARLTVHAWLRRYVVVARATARPVCQALGEALARLGCQILTDIQRQGVHCSFRPWRGAGDVRPGWAVGLA